MRKNGNNELNRGTKKSFISILPILGAGLLAAGALTGVGVSAWHVSQTYKNSSEFSDSVTARVKIDPVAFEIEGAKRQEDTATKNTKLAAERLSAWLKYNGQDSYDVGYELVPPESESKGQYFAYLSAKFKVTKIVSKHASDKERIDNDPYLSIFENKGFNTNNKSFVYRWYDRDHKESTAEADPKYTILNFSDLFVLPDKASDTSKDTKSMLDKDSHPGVVYRVDDQKNKEFLNNVYKDMLLYEEDTKATNKDIDAKVQPRIYIINNLEGMYNEATYHLTNWGYSTQGGSRYVWYDKIYKDSDYSKFASDYNTKDWKGTSKEPHSYELGTVGSLTPAKEKGEDIRNGDILNWIDAKTVGTLEHSSILSKYVEDIIPFSKIKDFFKENIDDNQIKNTIPKTKDEKCDIKYFWHSYANKNAADAYFETLIEKSWSKSKIVSIEFTDENDESVWDKHYAQFEDNYATTIVAPKFTETIFGNDNIVAVLSLGFLIFLIILGIILACLYRMTGLFSWICMMFALSMTGLIAVFGSASVISLSLLFGLFIMSMAGFMTAVFFCGRAKRRLLSNEDTQVVVSKAFKQSFWPTVDVSIIALIFGICFTYIAPLGLNPLGLVLIIGAFANVVGYLLNGLLHGLFFNNRITINRFGLLGWKHSNLANEAISQGRNDIPSSLDATKLNFPYYCNFSKKKLSVTEKKGIIAMAIAGGLLIACIVLFAVLGFINNKMFLSDNCLIITITDAASQKPLDWVSEVGLKYNNYIVSKDGLSYYFYCSGVTQQIIDQLTAKGGTVYLENLIGSTSRDILNMALVSIVVAASISTIYAGIRNNWTAFVPMLATTIGLPLIMLGLSAACQIKFDETVVLAYSLITVVNAMVSISIINSINTVWSRHDGYNKAELKFIVNEALKNNLMSWILMAACYALFIIAFGITAPIGCADLTILIVIGAIVTLLFAPYINAGLLYWFLVIRNKALRKRATKKANKVFVNYDEIDEQGIEGINKFTKKIAIPKDEVANHE